MTPSRADIPMPVLNAKTAQDLQANILATFFMLRGAIVLLSVPLPIVLYVVNVSAYGGMHERSISAFYGADAYLTRDYFVATMCAVGVALIAYKGFSLLEDLALDLAGGCAIGIALAPCRCWSGLDSHNRLHTFFAITFFAAMAVVVECFARQTTSLLKTDDQKRMFRAAYHVIGALLFLAPLAAIVAAYVMNVSDSRVFFIEGACVEVFALYWVVKSAEFRLTSAEKKAAKGELKKVGTKYVDDTAPEAVQQQQMAY